MLKAVTQYVVVCDNDFCDSILRTGVDHHSYERKQQFKRKVEELGWGGLTEEDIATHHLCPNCRKFKEGVFV